MSPGRNPHGGSSPSRQGSRRVLALSAYQVGKPFAALVGPTAARPSVSLTVTPVAANAVGATSTTMSTAASAVYLAAPPGAARCRGASCSRPSRFPPSPPPASRVDGDDDGHR